MTKNHEKLLRTLRVHTCTISGGHRRSEPKQVMFSDGIRPGGDLTELDGSAEVTRMPPRRSRVQKKVERHSQGLCLIK